MSIPKPSYCAQNWLAMKEVPGGRICSACEKKIIDFKGKSWREIESLQRENSNALCGMYSQKQLDHWGHEVPSIGMNVKAFAAVSSLLLSIATPSVAKAVSFPETIQTDTLQTPQPVEPIDTNSTPCCTYKFEGTVTDHLGEPLAFVEVTLKGFNVGSMTDFDGRYQFEVTGAPTVLKEPFLQAKIIGYEDYQIKLANLSPGEKIVNIQLKEPAEMAVFYVTVLKPRQRFWQKITRPFRRK